MKTHETTVEEVERARKDEEPPRPGLLLIFSGQTPAFHVFPLGGQALELGRAALADDERASRRHARIALEDGRWRVADLDS
jgi:hypothetical protein